jgi:hypothetical protein
VFGPVSMQVNKPDAVEQYMFLLAAAAAGPVAAVMAEIWVDGYAVVHSKPAGEVPEADKETLRRTVLPALPVAEDKLRVVACANKRSHG